MLEICSLNYCTTVRSFSEDQEKEDPGCWVIDVRTAVSDVLMESSNNDKCGTNSQSPKV